MAPLLLLGTARVACGSASLLVEDPFGRFGEMNPTGHAAIYLDHVCADSPTRLRPCAPGEMGVVLSRYHKIQGYDWLAMPVLPYLYAVERVSEVPAAMTPEGEARLRDAYRRRYLRALAPDLSDGSAPGGEWVQLVGSAYDREIHGFSVATTATQDARLIAEFNDRRNVSHFNLFFNNCADLSRNVLDLYYPHAVRRSFLADFGFTTPKHLAKMLTRYGMKHPEVGLSTFVIPQVPGTVERSRSVRGVEESLLFSKKYVAPLVFFYPEFTAGMAVAYMTRGRYTMPTDAAERGPSDFAPAAEVETVAAERTPAAGGWRRPELLTQRTQVRGAVAGAGSWYVPEPVAMQFAVGTATKTVETAGGGPEQTADEGPRGWQPGLHGGGLD